jgi:polar amino acid transport system substrate-binding protein
MKQLQLKTALPTISAALAAVLCLSVLPTTPAMAQTDDDLARVKSTKKLLVGTSADYPPYAFYNENFKVDGFEPALIGELAKRLGATAEINDFAFEGTLQALQLKQVDVVIAALSVTQERRQLVDFTNVYFIGADAVIGRSDFRQRIDSLDDLAGKKVAAEKGSVYATFLKENLVDKGLSASTDIFLYPDISNAVRDLKQKRFDLLLMDRLPGRTVDRANADLRVVAEGLNPQRFAIAVRKGSTLRSALNDALLTAQNDGSVATYVQQYLGLNPSETEQPTTDPSNTQPVPTTAPPSPSAPAAPPACIDGMAYVADLNYDDKNMTAPPIFVPGQGFTKSWRVRNSGNCNWAADYSLRFVFGNSPAAQMGGQSVVVGTSIAPNATVDLSANLIAPGVYGTYQGFWQMYNSAGVPFGERVWVGISVPNPNPPPTPTPPPTPGISFTVDNSTVNAGQCVNFSWNVQNVSGVWFYPDGQDYRGYGRPGVGTEQACPGQTTTYDLRVQRNDGSFDFRQITINVNQSPQGGGPQVLQFSADPNFVNVGQQVTVRWQTGGSVGRVTITRNGQAVWDGAPTQGQWNDTPNAAGTVTYGIIAYDASGQNNVNTTRQINVGSPGPNVNSLTTEGPSNQGGRYCVKVSWNTSNATGVRLLRTNATSTAQGMPIDGTQVNSYFIDCNNPPGTVWYQLFATDLQNRESKKSVQITIPK